MNAVPFLFSAFIGFITGILSGFGIGGGTLLVLYLTFIAQMPQAQAQGINLAYFLCAGIPAAISHAKSGQVDIKCGFAAAVSGCITAALAALLALKIEPDTARRVFGVFLLAAGLHEIIFAFVRRGEDEDNQDSPAK